MTVSYPIGEVDTGCCSWCGERVPADRKRKWCGDRCMRAAAYYRKKVSGPRCAVAGCDNAAHTKGVCTSCYSAEYRATVKKHVHVCAYCDQEFRTARTQKSETGRRFCTVDCSISWNNEFASDRESTTHVIECPQCGQRFDHIGVAPPKYCGSKCRSDEERRRVLSSRSELRRCYEDGDNPGFIAAVLDRVYVDDSGCWIWPKIKDNYPRYSIGNKEVAMHRAVLEAKEGAPLGSQAAHHKCANSHCVNPNHLQPVTHRENTAEMLARKSLTARISELEAALEEFDPEHELLKVIPVM